MQKRTIEILKNFAAINPGILIRKGNKLRTFSTAKNVFATAEVADDFPREFAIYDLNQFLSTLSLFENPNISYQTDHIELSSGSSSVRYYYSKASMIVEAPDRDMPEIDATYEFSLKKDELAQLIKSAAVMGFDTLEFTSKNVRAFNSKNKVANEFSLVPEDLKVLKDTKGSYRIPLELLKVLPLSYTVKVSDKNVVFKNEAEKVAYMIAALS